MTGVHIGPAILAAAAFGCGLNMINFGAIAAKEGWNVPAIAFMSAPQILGRLGMFLSLVVALFAAGWWGLLIAPAGGFVFGGVSTAIMKESTLPNSMLLGILSLLGSVTWLIAS